VNRAAQSLLNRRGMKISNGHNYMELEKLEERLSSLRVGWPCPRLYLLTSKTLQ